MLEEDLKRTVLETCKVMGLHTLHIRTARRGQDDPPNECPRCHFSLRGLRSSGTEGTHAGRRKRWETPVEGDGEGWPDLAIVGPGGVKFRELKSTKGTLSPAQNKWIGWLTEARADIGVWRPADLDNNIIQNELQALRRSMRTVPSPAFRTR